MLKARGQALYDRPDIDWAPPTVHTYGLFLLFVALAVYTQNLTGFALALVLLSLVGATDLVPLPDAVNAVTIIGVVNAGLFLYRRRALRLSRPLWPALGTSLAGTVIGVAALGWLMGSAYHLLGLLLAVSIIYCALLLWRAVKPLPQPSSRRSFMWFGLLSGLMGGLFAASGPPLVYQLYRQPWPIARIQESLVYLFGMGGLLRLILVWLADGFTVHAVQLAGLAVPVVILVTLLTAHRPPPVSPRVLRKLVCILLIGAGVAMGASAVSAMLAG